MVQSTGSPNWLAVLAGLRASGVLAGCGAPAVAGANPRTRLIFVEEAAHRFDVPDAWIRAVMQVESNGAVRAVSPKAPLA